MKKVKPIKKSIEAKGHTPQYRMHKYFARRPYNVFSNLISHYSNKNDIILDCFCGGGVTVFEGAALQRKVIGVDLNPLATFITRMQMFNGDIDFLRKVYDDFINDIKNKYNRWYFVEFEDDSGICEWIEWAYVVLCPFCQEKIVLTEENKIRNGIYKCKDQTCEGHMGIKRIDCLPHGSVPIRVRYKSDKSDNYEVRKIESLNQICDFNHLLEKLKNLKYKPNFEIPMDWDRQHEDKLIEKGVSEYKHLFTERNYAINCFIFNDILNMKDVLPNDIYEMLYFLFSSSLRYTNNMTRVTDNWEGGNPTSMDKHAYWLPNQYVETNIVDIINKRAMNILKGVEYSKNILPEDCKESFDFDDLKKNGGYLVLNRSSSDLPIPDKSVDVVITDPPYGSNVQYAELSAVWNAWFELFSGLDDFIYKEEEAVMNRKLKVDGAKTDKDYEELLYQVFSECNRVLKDGGYMVFTFNNKNLKVWIAMMRAVTRAGFYLPENGVIFQDFIKSYKNTAHLRYDGNIHGDFIYSFVKGENPITTDMNGYSLEELIEQNIDMKLESLYKKRKRYTTTELYQNIFSKLVGVMMTYIAEHINNNKEMQKIENYSNDHIDNLLKRKLDFSNGKWSKKEQ